MKGKMDGGFYIKWKKRVKEKKKKGTYKYV